MVLVGVQAVEYLVVVQCLLRVGNQKSLIGLLGLFQILFSELSIDGFLDDLVPTLLFR